jgi:hypothetical protein
VSLTTSPTSFSFSLSLSQLSEVKSSWLVSDWVSRKFAVAEAEDSSGTQSKGNVRHWKPLPSNG